jgi:hypothetical protein
MVDPYGAHDRTLPSRPGREAPVAASARTARSLALRATRAFAALGIILAAIGTLALLTLTSVSPIAKAHEPSHAGPTMVMEKLLQVCVEELRCPGPRRGR